VANIPAVTDQNFSTEVLQAPAAMVDFWAEW
jgi:thioredoxin-like negative regulator of GroEL